MQLTLSQRDIDLHSLFLYLIGRHPWPQPLRQLAHLLVQILQQQAAEPPLRQQTGELQPLAPHGTVPLHQVSIEQQVFQLIMLQAVQLERFALLDVGFVQLEPHLETAVEEVAGRLAIEAQQLRQLQPLLLAPFGR